jgi:hypothetical protein
MTDEFFDAEPDVEKTRMAGALLRSLGAPKDVKAPAVFLLADSSWFMTGTGKIFLLSLAVIHSLP